ncbi:MAG: hypothetical protein WAQ25_05105 [Candidatus Saccharimonas sp.]
MMQESFWSVLLVTIFVACVVYVLDSWYAKQWLTVERKTISYIAAALLIGIFGEVFTETIYNFLVHQPLWHYQFLPVHQSYTSLYSVILWAMYGVHLYWARVAIDTRYGRISKWKLATVFAIESLILETFLNLVWLGAFGYLIYFYTPTDLWHVTTIQNIPCYFAASWAIIGTVKRFNKDPLFFLIMALLLLTVFLLFP